MSSNMFYPNPHGQTCPWHNAAEKFGAPNLKWCEETLCQWISEPANTWSNGLYILIGVYLFYQWKKHAFLPLRYSSIGIIIMGVSSLIYHLSNFYLTQLLDFFGMFVCIYNLLFMNIHRLHRLTKREYLSYYISAIILSLFIVHWAYISHIPYQASVMVIVLLIFLTELYLFMKKKGAHSYLNFYLSIVFLSLAVMSTTLDLKRIWCDPTNHWIQGHAFWHFFSAIMMYFVHKHYEELWKDKKISQLK